MSRIMPIGAFAMLLLAMLACGPLSGLAEQAEEAGQATAEAIVESEFGDLQATVEAEAEALGESGVPGAEENGFCDELNTAAIAEIIGAGSLEATSQIGGACVLQSADFTQNVTITRIANPDEASAIATIEAQAGALVSEPVEGVGDQAFWLPEQFTFSLRSGSDVYLIIYATDQGLSNDRTVHESIARQILGE